MKKVVFNRLLIGCLGLIATLPVYAQDELLREDRPDTYSVVTGDTLWGISERFLKDPWRWKEVWQANSQIANPDLIYPGDVIRLIFVDGQPRLTIEREGEGSTTNSVPAPEPQTFDDTASTNRKQPLKTVKLSPKIYSSPVKQAIESIPLEQINNFLVRNRIVDTKMLPQAPHVVAGPEKRVILGAGDNLYARGSFAESTNSYGIYREGQRYIDPDTRKVLGVQAIDVGAVSRRALNGDIATFAITRSTGEIRVGDRLLPSEERQITSTFLPTPPDNQVKGVIMTIERGISKAGKLDIVAVNLGHEQGLKQGHLLAVDKRGERISDRYSQRNSSRRVSLPDERSGLVLIFQVFERMSLGIILEADKGINVKDIVRTP